MKTSENEAGISIVRDSEKDLRRVRTTLHLRDASDRYSGYCRESSSITEPNTSEMESLSCVLTMRPSDKAPFKVDQLLTSRATVDAWLSHFCD